MGNSFKISRGISETKPISVNKYNLRIDLWIKLEDKNFAFELKYKKRAFKTLHKNEAYNLGNDSARDQGRYDFIKDIQRLEMISAQNHLLQGYAVFLTNDSGYWEPLMGKSVQDIQFRLYDNRILERVLSWSNNPSAGTIKTREKPIELKDEFQIKWESYSRFEAKYGEFRHLIVAVPSSMLHPCPINSHATPF